MGMTFRHIPAADLCPAVISGPIQLTNLIKDRLKEIIELQNSFKIND